MSELLEAAKEVVAGLDRWNDAIQTIIGLQPNTGIGLERLRAAIAAAEARSLPLGHSWAGPSFGGDCCLRQVRSNDGSVRDCGQASAAHEPHHPAPHPGRQCLGTEDPGAVSAHETPQQTLARLAEIELRAAAAEPGPWGWRAEGPSDIKIKRRHWRAGSVSSGRGLAIVFGDDDSNARFVAAARSDVPALVALVRELLARRKSFPVLMERGAAPHPTSIPWSVADLAYSVYRQRYGDQQTLDQIAARGGFGPSELDSLLPEWRSLVSEIEQLRAERDHLTSELAERRQGRER